MTLFPRILFVIGVLLLFSAKNALTEGLERTSLAAGVTGVAAPMNLYDPAAPTIDFAVVLDSGEFHLPADIAGVSLLGDGAEVIVPALSWTGSNGPLHRSGTLVFPAGSFRSARVLILTVQLEGEAVELTFRWDGPFTGPPSTEQ